MQRTIKRRRRSVLALGALLGSVLAVGATAGDVSAAKLEATVTVESPTSGSTTIKFDGGFAQMSSGIRW